MERSLQSRLSGSFGSAADAYAASRPGYPDEAVGWLVGEQPAVVLDLAAGTGSFTRALARAGHRVTAAESSETMLGRLHDQLPTISAVAAAAERLPFAVAAFDVVTVATAFHWFDAGPALSEAARVLRAGGRLCLLWNTRTKTRGWSTELSELLHPVQPPGLDGDWGAGSSAALVSSDLFDDVRYAEFGISQVLDRASLRDLVASRSYVAALEPDDQADLFDRLDALYDRHTAPDQPTLLLAYRTQCWRAVKRQPV